MSPPIRIQILDSVPMSCLKVTASMTRTLGSIPMSNIPHLSPCNIGAK